MHLSVLGCVVPQKRSRAMRWALIPVFLLWMASPSWAAKRMTVAQLEQMLISDSAAHKSDLEMARKIGGIELSERLTEFTLDRLNKHFPSNSQAGVALLLLADRSAFLDPPAKELPATPAPDLDDQNAAYETELPWLTVDRSSYRDNTSHDAGG